MATDFERAINHAAYKKYRGQIDATYPKDWFVAINGGKIAADGESFDVVFQALIRLGLNPRDSMMVQSGEPDMPSYDLLGISLGQIQD